VNDKSEILDLPKAVNADGKQLYHSLEWCKFKGIVIVSEDGKDWVSPKGDCRYRATPTGAILPQSFPPLMSHRKQ
jgi:hypothetical protein